QHHHQRVLRFGFLGYAVEDGFDLGARGVRTKKRVSLGVGGRFERFVYVFGPAAEALLVLRLAAQSGDGYVIRRCLDDSGAGQRQKNESHHTTPHFRRSSHSIDRSERASRNTNGISQMSFVSRVVIPASEYEICCGSLAMSFAV